MQIVAEPLTRAAFAPFGNVIPPMTRPGRAFFNDNLSNARPAASIDLSLALLEPMKAGVLRATVMERHRHSSQTFLPLRVARYLVVVAPHGRDGRPDVAGARAFIADGRRGLTYRADIWHHGLTVLDEPGEFAVLMWCDRTEEDEEFCTLDRPFTVLLS